MQTNFNETEVKKRGELSPARLGEKLKRIRDDYDLTQGKMLLIINPIESCETNRARVSQYENGTRVPSLVETYNYARFAGVTMETLVNDELDLPATIRQTSDEQNDLERGTVRADTLQNTNDESSLLAVESQPAVESPETCLMPISIERLGRCRKMYFELLEELPFDPLFASDVRRINRTGFRRRRDGLLDPPDGKRDCSPRAKAHRKMQKCVGVAFISRLVLFGNISGVGDGDFSARKFDRQQLTVQAIINLMNSHNTWQF